MIKQLTSLAAALLLGASSFAWGATTGGSSSCDNEPDQEKCYSCGGGCASGGCDHNPKAGLECGPAESISGYLSGNYLHDAIDYQTDAPLTGASSCVPCGGEAEGIYPKTGKLALLTWRRYYNSRRKYDYSSFGRGWFNEYDAKIIELKAYDKYSRINEARVFLPSYTGKIINAYDVYPSYGDNTIDGHYHDQGYFRDVKILDSAGQVTSDQSQAVTIDVVFQGGHHLIFEIFEEGGTKRGRLIRREDRNGQGSTVTYIYPVTATDGDLGGDRTRLWQMATVVDSYGNTAAITYGTEKKSNSWVIDHVDFPNTTTVSYGYTSTTLASVDLPDGTQSTFTYGADAAWQADTITFDDAAASGTHRRKTVYFSTSTYTDPNTLVTFNRPRGLTVRITQPDSSSGIETALARWWDDADADINYFYEGGNRLLRFKQLNKIVGEISYATNYIHDDTVVIPDLSGIVWNVEKAADQSGALKKWRLTETMTDYYGRSSVGTYIPLQRVLLTDSFYDDTQRVVSGYTLTNKPLSITDRIGRITTNTYDANDNRLSKTRAVGTVDEATWSWTYNTEGQPLTATDANGNVKSYVYNANHQLIEVHEPGDNAGDPDIVRTYSYDSAGRMSETVDGGGHVVRYAYDIRNRVGSMTYGFYTSPSSFYAHSSESLTYGTGQDANLVMSHTDRNGVVTQLAYDAQGRRIQTIEAAGTSESIIEECSYLAGTELELSCTKAGETTVSHYDYRNRRAGFTQQVNGTTLLTSNRVIDVIGRTLKFLDAYGRASYFVYDINDQVLRRITETVPLGAGVDPYVYLTGGSVDQSSVVAAQSTLAALVRDLSNNAGYLITDSIYDAEGQRIASIDARGILDTASYNSRGLLVSQTEGVAAISGIEAAYLAHTDQLGFINAGDAYAAMVQTPTAVAATSSTIFDLQGNRLSTTNPRGFITSYSYTQRNLVDTITEATGTADAATRLIAYTATRKQAMTSDFRGNVTTYSYYPCCDWLAQVTDQTGAVTSYVYDNEQHIVSLTDPNNNTTLTTYDALYRVLTRTNAENEITTYAYDDNATDGVGLDLTYASELIGLGLAAGSDGQIVTVTNAEGETSVQIGDGVRRTVRTIDGLNHINTTTYDVVINGLLEVSSTDALGNITRGRSDAAGRILESIDAENNSTAFSFDANSNRISYRDANNVGQDCTFDERNRDVSCTDTQGDTTTKTYDANNNVIIRTDALGQVDTCVFDARDRRVSCTDRINATTSYSYDDDSNLLTIVDAEGGQTTYGYDSRNLLVDETFPAGNTGTTHRLYTYDAGRRLTQRSVTTVETPAIVEDTNYAYDMANRLLTRTYPQEASTQDQFAYDDASRLTAATSQRYSNNVTRTYDNASRLTSESLVIDGSTYIIGYSYDDANRQTSITYPDGKVIERAYTDRNLLASVGVQGEMTSLITSLYDAGQRETTRTYGNGLVRANIYRPDNLINQITVNGLYGSVLDLSYSYDANKRKTEEIDALTASASQTFNYDTEDRLSSWAGNSNTQSWNLSAVGDWDATIKNGTIENRTHTAVHEVSVIDGNLLAYDFKGNLTSHSNGQLYAWDSENRMTSANGTLTADYTNAVYRYDALGRRVAKTTTRKVIIPAGALHHVDSDQMTTWGQTGNLVTDPDRGQVMGYNSGTSDNLTTFIQNLNGSDAFTISLWAKADEIPTDKGMFKTNATEDDSSKAIYLRYDKVGYNSGTATEIIKGGVDTTGGRLKYESADHTQTTEWQHLTLSWESGDRIRLFINGVEDEPSYDNGAAIGVLQNITGFILGRSVKDNAAGASWNGLLDDLRIYDRALAPVEVTNLYTADQYPLQNSGTTVDITDTTVYAMAGTQVVQEYNNDVLGNSYVYGTYVDEPVALINENNETYYYHQNYHYSVEVITSQNAQVVESYDYDAYGKTIKYDSAGNEIGNSLIGNPYGFTGRRIDRETGLYFFRARYYDVELGRFTGRDPKNSGVSEGGYHDGMNLYSGWFVPNKVDYTGMGSVMCVYSPAAKTPGIPEKPNTGSVTAWISNATCWCMDDDGETCDYVSKSFIGLDSAGVTSLKDAWIKAREGKPCDCPDDDDDGDGEPIPDPIPVPIPFPILEPIPVCACVDEGKVKEVAVVAAGVTLGYLTYRCVRMVPSLFPALWWTIPGNVVTP